MAPDGATRVRYQAKDDSTETDAYGAKVGCNCRWSEVTGVRTALFYEQNDVTDYVPVRSEESTAGWGGDLTAYREMEVSVWRFSVGRRFIPTGEAGKAESDQFRLEYDRDLSQRLAFEGAARYESRSSLTENGSDQDRDYARVDLSLRWLMTQTWFAEGGYSYIWQDRQSESDDAANNKLFLSVGYKGLRRQRNWVSTQDSPNTLCDYLGILRRRRIYLLTIGGMRCSWS